MRLVAENEAANECEGTIITTFRGAVHGIGTSFAVMAVKEASKSSSIGNNEYCQTPRNKAER